MEMRFSGFDMDSAAEDMMHFEWVLDCLDKTTADEMRNEQKESKGKLAARRDYKEELDRFKDWANSSSSSPSQLP
eukprot:5835308-Pyramimonas_sp.AAC.1